MTNKILIFILIISAGFFAFQKFSKKEEKAVVSKVQTNNKLATQEKEEANVTVKVTPKTLAVGKNPVFDLAFDTHSVDLSFDVGKTVSLVNDKGIILQSSVWNGSAPGGHHREGTLTFNSSLSQTKSVQLIIKGIAGVSERKFSWKLN